MPGPRFSGTRMRTCTTSPKQEHLHCHTIATPGLQELNIGHRHNGHQHRSAASTSVISDTPAAARLRHSHPLITTPPAPRGSAPLTSVPTTNIFMVRSTWSLNRDYKCLHSHSISSANTTSPNTTTVSNTFSTSITAATSIQRQHHGRHRLHQHETSHVLTTSADGSAEARPWHCPRQLLR